MTVDIDHETIQIDPAVADRCIRVVLRGEGVEEATVGVVLSGHSTIRELNRKHLGHDYETDVLSFDLGAASDPRTVDGEIYVDLDTAAERCAEFNAPLEQEACRYLIHGLLHLAGYDDATAAARKAMTILEDAYLEHAGLLSA